MNRERKHGKEGEGGEEAGTAGEERKEAGVNRKGETRGTKVKKRKI